VRAGLVAPDQPLSAFPWSSYPRYLAPAGRPAWLRVDRLLGEHGITADSTKGRMEFRRRMEQRRGEGEAPEMLAALGWSEEDLARRPKANPGKVRLAQALRAQTPMTREWIGRRLALGSASYVTYLLAKAGTRTAAAGGRKWIGSSST
jgi:hypothetical protein